MRILIQAPAWVGDMVMAQVLVQRLRDTRPGAHIDLVAPPATAPLGDRMPGVVGTFVLDVPHGRFGLGPRRALAAQLRRLDYDAAWVLPNSWKSALAPALAGIPERTGFLGEARYGLLTDPRRLDAAALPRMIDRFAALAEPAGAPLPDPLPRPRLRHDDENAARLRAELGLDGPGSVLACCPGAEFGAAKRWPPRHFAALAAAHVEAGGQVWLLGSPKDVETTSEILAALPAPARDRVHDLAGRTRLLDAVDLLAEADAVVSNDSGLMHVACAVDRPTVALYGSTSPDFTPPLGPRVAAVSLDLDCSPCFERVCPLGHLDCLETLMPARVEAALAALGAAPARPVPVR